jgi:hypothetical protein
MPIAPVPLQDPTAAPGLQEMQQHIMSQGLNNPPPGPLGGGGMAPQNMPPGVAPQGMGGAPDQNDPMAQLMQLFHGMHAGQGGAPQPGAMPQGTGGAWDANLDSGSAGLMQFLHQISQSTQAPSAADTVSDPGSAAWFSWLHPQGVTPPPPAGAPQPQGVGAPMPQAPQPMQPPQPGPQPVPPQGLP